MRGLPRFSRYHLARADDDDLAAVEARLGLAAPSRPSLAAWDAHQDLIATMRDEFAALRALLIAVNSPKGKAPKVKPTPRPITAAQRAERRAEKTAHDHIVAQVTPRG